MKIVKIFDIKKLTHDVKRFRVEKPKGYSFEPGQATLVSIDKKGFQNEKRPFTFSCTNEDEYLEFIIKIYEEHNGVTLEMNKLVEGDKLIIDDPWGAIKYNEEGVFVGGGAGVTPFISILRDLKKKNKMGNNMLILSNKKKDDIIIEEELKEIFKDKPEDLIFTLTREKMAGYEYGRIDKKFFERILNRCPKNFYVCGPPEFVSNLKKIIESLGCNVQSVIFEK